MNPERGGGQHERNESDKQHDIYTVAIKERDPAKAINIITDRLDALHITPAEMKPELVDLVLRLARDLAKKQS